MGFQLIAIAVLSTFYACYFIKMICQKRKGIQTDQIGKGKFGFVKFIEITMRTAAFLVVAVEVLSA